MKPLIEELIEHIWSPPRGVKLQHKSRNHPDNLQYYRHWGFTIYRTHYSPETDRHWNMLLNSLKKQTILAFGYFEGKRDIDESDVQLLKDLFHLEAREDASLLKGLDIRGVRELCRDEDWETERAMAGYLYEFVLVADESVLKDIANGESVVKAVSLSWSEGFSGWGWMRIPTSYLLDLWMLLSRHSFGTESVISFNGPEKDLDTYVWPGDVSLPRTGRFSEVRPLLFHYTGQRPDRTFEGNRTRRNIVNAVLLHDRVCDRSLAQSLGGVGACLVLKPIGHDFLICRDLVIGNEHFIVVV
ncbi:hypothetical protein FOC1_g10008951 [Fusarium oxysporum f. sp. cubense race 1]|uniref:Uncharacterized protein n=1 Tax=Fusarium oxysporum f. sp. cubense (strain race 1) TaxID=1229664 RepID=N4UTJ5_FUSC1|nr:hypothetical protein FOC1_g10008951 [Fusarium oxysporum f. sp. cubense race 1]